MSFYSTWQIAPTRPHPLGMQGRYISDQPLGSVGAILASLPWDQIVSAGVQVGVAAAPVIIDGVSQQAGAMAQAQGASSAQIAAIQAAAHKRAQEEIAAKAAKEKAIRQRNWIIAGGIAVVGILGAVIILKK